MFFLLHGLTRTIDVDGVQEEVTPYVAVREAADPRLTGVQVVGIGIQVTGNDEVWFQSPGPNVSIVRLLAALLVLNRLPAYCDRVIAEALLFASEARGRLHEPCDTRETILDLLGGNRTAYDELRKEAMEYHPDFEALDEILLRLYEAQLPVNTDELFDLVRQHRLVMSPLMVLHDHLLVAHRNDCDTYQEFLETPLRFSEWSLADYLTGIGVRTLVDIRPISGSNITNGHFYPVAETDSLVKEVSTGAFGVPLRLLKVSGLLGTRLRQRTTKVEIVDENGTVYTLDEAFFRNGEIIIKTLVDKPGAELKPVEYTVAQLRLWIRPVPAWRKFALRYSRKRR